MHRGCDCEGASPWREEGGERLQPLLPRSSFRLRPVRSSDARPGGRASSGGCCGGAEARGARRAGELGDLADALLTYVRRIRGQRGGQIAAAL